MFRMPSLVIKLLFGEMGEKLLLKGNIIRPKRIILEAGYTFQYPHIDQALSNIINKS